MSVVVKSNIFTVVVINTGSGDDRSAEVSADILDDLIVVGESGFSIDIKEVSAEGVEDTDESGRKVFGFVHFEEHTPDDIADGVKKTIQQFAVLTEKGRSSSGIVKTQCLCLVRMSLKDIAVERRIE